jgi:hypothetical protein
MTSRQPSSRPAAVQKICNARLDGFPHNSHLLQTVCVTVRFHSNQMETPLRLPTGNKPLSRS